MVDYLRKCLPLVTFLLRVISTWPIMVCDMCFMCVIRKTRCIACDGKPQFGQQFYGLQFLPVMLVFNMLQRLIIVWQDVRHRW